MDTKKDSAVSDVPTFKVARVGEERKRKGAGFSLLRGGGARGVWSGATGGGAGVNALGMNFSKAMMMIMLAAGIGSASIYMGALSAASSGKSASGKPSIFSQDNDHVKLEGDTSNLPSNASSIPNSLGYLSGSLDGLTPEERAKKAADAAAAAEAQRKADEEAAKKAAADNAAGKPADPAALLASAKADGGKGGGLGSKFGALSSSFGGGSSLSGGAGLSGGVNRQFASAGAISKGTGGQLSAMKAASRPTYSRAGNSKVASSNVQGFARKQLANANALSRNASSAGKGETSAVDAASAFDNNLGAGNVISGPGIGTGEKPSAGTDSTPISGGPTGPSTGDCASGSYMNANGACQAVPTTGVKDANPMLTMLSSIATGLLVLISILAMIAMITEKITFTQPISGAIKTVIGVLGGIIAMMGMAIIANGDYFSGTVFTVVGAGIGILAFTDVMALTPAVAIVASLAGAAVGQAAKMLDPKKNPAPAAAQ